MEVKILCECGTKFKFDVEPVNGRMPMGVACPGCSNDRTFVANEIIATNLGIPVTAPIAAPRAIAVTASAPVAVAAPVAAALGGGLRISRAEPETATDGARNHDHGPRSLLERSIFLVKERVAVLKLTDTYDIIDPANGQTIGIAKEEPPGWAKFLRLAMDKHQLPTAINIYEAEGAPPTVSVRRGFTFLRSKLQVTAGGKSLGYFKSKLISVGGSFLVFDTRDQQVAEVKGDWKGWNFRFLNKGGREIGTVTKKWAGLGKELFTSADNYVVSLTDPGVMNPEITALFLAAALCIDMVFKED